MGPLEENNISELTLRPINPDGSYGDPIEIENFENVTYSLDENVDKFYTIGFDLAKESDITAYGYIRIPNKKTSRKTFKKWLMSKGFDRDLSEWFCKVVKSFKGQYSYQTLYFNGLFSSTSQDLFNILFDTLFPIPNLTLNNKETEK